MMQYLCLQRDKLPYHREIPLQGQEEFILRKMLVSVHVPRKEHGLLQGFSNVPYSTPLIFLDRGIPGNWYPIHLEPRAPSTLCHAHFNLFQLIAAFHRRGPFVPRLPGYFLVFCAMTRTHLAFLKRLDRPFLLQVRINFQVKVGGDLWRGRRKVGGELRT